MDLRSGSTAADGVPLTQTIPLVEQVCGEVVTSTDEQPVHSNTPGVSERESNASAESAKHRLCLHLLLHWNLKLEVPQVTLQLIRLEPVTN